MDFGDHSNAHVAHSRSKRQAEALDLVQPYVENITPLIAWTLVIFLLVCITLPLLFCGEQTCFSDWYKDEPDDEEPEAEVVKEEDDDDTLYVDESQVSDNKREFIKFIHTFNLDGDNPKPCTCDGRTPQAHCPCHGGEVPLLQTGSSISIKEPTEDDKKNLGCTCVRELREDDKESLNEKRKSEEDTFNEINVGGEDKDKESLGGKRKPEEDTFNDFNGDEDKDKAPADGGASGCQEGSGQIPCAPPATSWLQWDWDDPCCGCNEDFVAKRVKASTWSQLAQYGEAEYENQAGPKSGGKTKSRPNVDEEPSNIWDIAGCGCNEEFVEKRLKQTNWYRLLQYAQADWDVEGDSESTSRQQSNRDLPLVTSSRGSGPKKDVAVTTNKESEAKLDGEYELSIVSLDEAEKAVDEPEPEDTPKIQNITGPDLELDVEDIAETNLECKCPRTKDN